MTNGQTGSSQIRHLLRAMRPKQWVKNVFVFSAIVFAKENLLLDAQAVGTIMTAFLLFCFVSSSIYLLNDLVDIEKDRQHPEKRHRPLPSGDLSPTLAGSAIVVVLLTCLAVIGHNIWAAPASDKGWMWYSLVIGVYFVLQSSYTFGLKHVVLVDVFIIAAGFVLRAVAGAAVISVEITAWWILSVFFLALFLALGKRRTELQSLRSKAGDHRPILLEYSRTFLDYLLLIVVACTIIVYSQATFTAPMARMMSYPYLILTTPFVVFALFRYLFLIIQKEESGDIADIIFQDRPLLATIVSWAVMVLIIKISVMVGA